MDIEHIETITPQYSDNYVAIAANSSNEYVPYLSVYLESIKAHASKEINYDVVILEKSITPDNKQILKECFEISNNLSLRFYNPEMLFENYNLTISHSYLCQESYFRLSAPLVFKNYDKLIFTDVDLIFNEDPYKLYKLELNNASILAVLEPIWSAWINKNQVINAVNIIDYSKNILKLNDLHRYFNTGVMLMDIKKLNPSKVFPLFLSRLASDTVYLYQDQDILNEVLQNEIGVLPFSWNHEVLDDGSLDYANSEFVDYCQSAQNFIIHWVGPNKPWIGIDRMFAYKWWQFAMKSLCYPFICKKYIEYISENKFNELFPVIKQDYRNFLTEKLDEINNNVNQISEKLNTNCKYLKNKHYYYFKYYGYKTLYYLSFGKKFKSKKDKYKCIINQIRNI